VRSRAIEAAYRDAGEKAVDEHVGRGGMRIAGMEMIKADIDIQRAVYSPRSQSSNS